MNVPEVAVNAPEDKVPVVENDVPVIDPFDVKFPLRSK